MNTEKSKVMSFLGKFKNLFAGSRQEKVAGISLESISKELKELGEEGIKSWEEFSKISTNKSVFAYYQLCQITKFYNNKGEKDEKTFTIMLVVGRDSKMSCVVVPLLNPGKATQYIPKSLWYDTRESAESSLKHFEEIWREYLGR